MLDEICIARKGDADYDTLVPFQIKAGNEVVFETSLPTGVIEITCKTGLPEIEVVCDMKYIIFKQKGGFIITTEPQ